MTQLKFAPIPLLDQVLIAGGVDPEEQGVLLAGFRTLVRSRLTELMADLAVKDRRIASLLEGLVSNRITPENLAEQLSKLSQEISQRIPPEKLQTMLAVVLVTSFLDVVNPLLETTPAEKKEKIQQILDQDQAFGAIFASWKNSRGHKI